MIDRQNREDIPVTVGSNNVFADIGVPNPEEALLKAQLAFQINDVIRQRGFTQVEAAERLGIDQPKVSAIRAGRLRGFSVDRLIRFLTLLGNDVEIVVQRANQALGETSVRAVA
ncbi:MAG: helix-turn-helix domain-containing protein [Chloroflexota bacterium]